MSADQSTGARHWLGFLISGLFAFAVDAGLTKLFVSGLGWSPFGARLAAMPVALAASFFGHRRLTFAMATAPTLTEFARFVGVAWTSAAINYAVYAWIIWLRPGTEPIAAVFLSSAVAMVASYLGMRFKVFRKV